MGYYRGATICLNGHIVSRNQANCQPFCSKCGKETYSECRECGASIHGFYEDGLPSINFRYERPDYCYSCGAAYPWTQKLIDNAIELVSLDEELDETAKSLIRSAIPDLITDTPTTPVAVAKYKKGVAKAGQVVRDALYNLLIDVISEATKKALFGQ